LAARPAGRAVFIAHALPNSLDPIKMLHLKPQPAASLITLHRGAVG